MTMFEVGKLSDETLDSFLAELEKVRPALEAGMGTLLGPENNDMETHSELTCA